MPAGAGYVEAVAARPPDPYSPGASGAIPAPPRDAKERVLGRNILAVVAGLASAWVTMVIVQAISSFLYMRDAGIDTGDAAALKAWIATAPLGAFLLLILGYVVSSLVGGWVAARLARSRPLLLAVIVGLFLLLGGIANFMTIPHPTWVAVLALVAYIPCAWLGGRLGARRAPLAPAV